MSDDKLAKLKQQRDELNSRIRRETTKESIRIRKQQDSVKILLGAAILNRLNAHTKDDKTKAIENYNWCRDALSEEHKKRLDKGIKTFDDILNPNPKKEKSINEEHPKKKEPEPTN